MRRTRKRCRAACVPGQIAGPRLGQRRVKGQEPAGPGRDGEIQPRFDGLSVHEAPCDFRTADYCTSKDWRPESVFGFGETECRETAPANYEPVCSATAT